jgi:hypothetical protein
MPEETLSDDNAKSAVAEIIGTGFALALPSKTGTLYFRVFVLAYVIV